MRNLFMMIMVCFAFMACDTARAEYFKASGQIVTKTTTSTGYTVTAVPVDGLFGTLALCTSHLTGLKNALPVWNSDTTDNSVFTTVRFYVIGTCTGTGINQ